MSYQSEWERAHALVNAIQPRKGVGAAVCDNPEQHVVAFDRTARAGARESALNDAIAALQKVGDFRGVAVVKKLLAGGAK